MSESVTLRSDIPVEEVQQVGSDEMIVRAARVSHGADAEAASPAKQAGLLRHLTAFRHGRPFEHGLLTVRVEAPLFVWREWMTHRWLSLGDESPGLSFNEQSGRYGALRPAFWVPPADRPLCPVDGWKPGRPKFQHDWPAGRATTHLLAPWEFVRPRMERVCRSAWEAYAAMVDAGVAYEVACRVLPVTVYSAAYVSGNPRAWLHFLSLRTHDGGAAHVSYPQAEIEGAARQVEAMVAKHWPAAHAAFAGCGRIAP